MRALPAYGPIPAYPKSPFLPANAATNPYPFSVSSATSLLKSHGWTVNAGGTDVCQNAGSGPNQCGAGIPAGTQLKFNLIYNSGSNLITSEMTDLASKAKQAGINITLQSSNFNYMISNYLDPYAPANENKWAMQDFGGETNSTYADHVQPVQHRRFQPDRRLQRPEGRRADQRLHHQH